ncbi:MAG TPA: uroporphyrinogen-III synthase [Solirubrobacterales bacterium]|nr:uroporphyrinogen-III synthase [Solirubrobacterales bacterium]
MIPSLRGKTIALTESRRATELATLVTRLGGVAYVAPAIREVPCTDRGPALAVLERIYRGEVHVVLFLTGVGTRAFLELASETGARERLLAALAHLRVCARGPKPIAVLREAGVRIDLVPPEPTSAALLAALSAIQGLRGAVVAVQLYGEASPALVEGLVALGATVLEIPLYEWAPPEDGGVLERLVRDLIAGRIDVLAFTSSPQVANVFAAAERLGLGSRLIDALGAHVAVATIGPVCAAALRERGVAPSIQADRGTMGALVHAIAAHLDGEACHA